MKDLTRRNFVKTTAAAVAASALPGKTAKASPGGRKTRYIAAYDAEATWLRTLPACREIVRVHKKFAMPATFFVLAKMLLGKPREFRELLDDPLFEVASHTYDHKALRDHGFCGAAASPEQIRKEVVESKKVIEGVFEKPCIGLRPFCGFDNGFIGAKDVLALVREAGYGYASSLLWGPDCSMPALLREPFTYSADGFPEIWELPGHGWHENVLKNNGNWGPKRLTLWPSPMPEGIPKGLVQTPEDEFAVHRVFLEEALKRDKTFVSLIWHPHSLHRFDPDMKMLDLTFTHVHKLGLEPCTYTDLYREASGEK